MTLLERLLPAVGDVVNNRYELREEIGRGGFGIVFRATQRGLNEDVAIKILLPHVLEHEDVAQRFEREVIVAKGLRHPNTIRILDYDKTEKGLPYYVMEMVNGTPLDDLINEQGPLSPARTRRIGVQILKSLGEAHSKGVVHRDLKPPNMIITEIYGEEDFVKVLDFGIAKALTGETALHMTSTGMVLGTPAYMSPEQALGKKDMDGRSDLYAVGLILAECLSSKPVVQGETPYMVVAQHATTQPLPFMPALLETPLWPIIQRATQKDRNLRFRDANEMRQSLEALGPLPEGVSPSLSGDYPTTPIAPPGYTPATPITGGGFAPSTPAGTPQGMVIQGNHSAKTVAGTSDQFFLNEQQPKKGGAGKAIAILIVLAVLVGGGVFFVVNSGSKGSGDANASSSGVANDESEAAADGQTPSTSGETSGSQVAAVNDNDSNPRSGNSQVGSAVSFAAGQLGSAVPQTRSVHFEGDQVTVTYAGHDLGETPLDLVLPNVDARLEFQFAREGYQPESREVSLRESRVAVDLQRQESASRSHTDRTRHDRRDRDRESDDTTHNSDETGNEPDDESSSTSPFGQTAIHD